MPTTARSRSRSRSRSQSVIPAQHVHPLAFQPQPQGVRLANTWISLHREVWALRITIRILNLILAALWNLPVRYSSTVASRIGASTWTRDRSINRGQDNNFMYNGTSFLRHHLHPIPQVLWLLSDLPRHIWNIQQHQRAPLLSAANTMTEYLLTFLYIQQDVPLEQRWLTLDTAFLEVFMNNILTIGQVLHDQFFIARRLMTEAPGSLPPCTDPTIRYYLRLFNRHSQY